MSTTAAPETNDSVDMDKVIARIQKILSRTKDGSGTTEAEAETAMKMAQELMSKYNLDMAVVEAAGAQSKDHNAAPAERVKDEVKGKAMYKWQQTLARYVAEANFCYHLLRKVDEWQPAYYKLDAAKLYPDLPRKLSCEEFDGRWDDAKLKDKYGLADEDLKLISHSNYTYSSGRYKNTASHLFVGRKANVITAQLMYQYLTQTIEDLVMVEMDLENAQRLSRSAMSWKEGCADRLCERLSARRQDLIAKHDARVQQEAADRKAAADQARQEASNKPKGLPANHETEVKVAYANMASDARQGHSSVGDDEVERPEIDDSEEPWLPQGEEIAQPEVGTSLVLASVYDQNERDANWELAHGYEPGTLAKWRAEREEEKRKVAEVEAEEEMAETDKPVKEETERQRKARERREQKEMEKNRRRWAREDEAANRRWWREYEKRDHSAYKKGQAKGADIGLDLQVKAGQEAKRLK